MKMLSEGSKNLCVVGDDDQSIYAFRGSDPSFILNFEKDFANTTVITLNQNYRSAHAIVSSANKVIARNTARRQKKWLPSLIMSCDLPSSFHTTKKKKQQ